METFPLLARYQEELGYDLDPTAVDRLTTLRDLLLDWNRRFNLTRVTDPRDIETRLYLDACAMLPLVRHVSDNVRPDSPRPIALADIGAGAGFPGFPLKIVAPEIELVLIEATAKKVSFLDEVISVLGLRDTTAIHGRAEELAHKPEFRARFDVVTARAVARLPALIEICMPFCRPGGRGIFPKGREVEQEISSAANAVELLRCTIIQAEASHIPELSGTTFVVVRQISSPPDRYPRRSGIPAKDPL